MLKFIFWICFFIVGYTFLGYTIILWILVSLKKIFSKNSISTKEAELPSVCLFVPAYNEIDYIDDKVKNLFELDYPKDKIQYLWISDGSDDGTYEKLLSYPDLQVIQLPERKGKINAINQGMKYVENQIVIFSDCNAFLSKESINEIVHKFRNSKVGCVAGEKRIVRDDDSNAASFGENIYWQYESFMKKMDAELNTVIGADGGLFAIRKELFEEVESDTIIDDFVISLRIVQKGYKIAYAPKAYVAETASANVQEELKRKIRIAAGGLQFLFRLPALLNPFKYGWLSFQYFSHKVLRWIFAPFALLGLFIVNLLIFIYEGTPRELSFFLTFLILQLTMYLLAVLGGIFHAKKVKPRALFAPYYFVVMNYASIAGIFRFIKGKQKVTWEKSVRA